MSLILRHCNLSDILIICLQLSEEERAQYEAFTGVEYNCDRVATESYRFPGPKWVICDEAEPGTPLVAAGGILMHPGCYRTWYYAAAAAWKHGVEVTALTNKAREQMIENGATRIETVCLANRMQTRRWYERCGMRFESTLENFGVHGEDAVMYVCTVKAGVSH